MRNMGYSPERLPQALAATRLNLVLASYFRWRPVNATFIGTHDYDHLLPDWSPAGLTAILSDMREHRDDLARFALGFPGIAAPAEDEALAVDLALADSFLEIQIAELEGRHFQRGNPSLVVGEAVFGLISLMIRDFAHFPRRLESATARMNLVPMFLNNAWASLRGHPIPREWTSKALREGEGARRLFRGGISRWCADHEASTAETTAAEEAAATALGAVEWFAEQITRAPEATDDAYACGTQMLDLLVRRGHWMDVSHEVLLQDARRLFDEARRALSTMAQEAAPGGWNEVQQRLADLHPAPDEYLAAFEVTWAACRDLAIAHDLVSWPELPVRYVPIPPWTRDAAPFLYYLFYRSPAPGDGQDSDEYAVPPLPDDADERERHLRAWNDSVIKLNHVVHHGAIGHHVQNVHATLGRSTLGRFAAVDCASRIAMFLGGTLAEGWACYATDLMGEVGFATPLESVAEQYARVRQLGRAIADISLHTGAMSLDQVTAFYRESVGMSAEAARAEAVKNSMFPGTAMMYWIGTKGLHDLRAAVQARDGEAFSLRAFHDEVLSYGSIPVALISRLMLKGGPEA